MRKIDISDIYYKINFYLAKNNYDNLDLNDKKELIENGLRNYTINKINDISGNKVLQDKADKMSLSELIETLAVFIPKEKHFDTLRHYTHVILNIAGNLQGYSITWINDVDNPVTEPIAKFNENGIWYELETHTNPDQVTTFYFVYETFRERFMNDPKVNISYVLE